MLRQIDDGASEGTGRAQDALVAVRHSKGGLERTSPACGRRTSPIVSAQPFTQPWRHAGTVPIRFALRNGATFKKLN
jgi:hypothetical protein